MAYGVFRIFMKKRKTVKKRYVIALVIVIAGLITLWRILNAPVPTYQTLIVKFGETIENLNRIFDDAEFWGTSTLKGWVESYESTRLTEIGKDTAVITSEYNMDYVKEWLERHATIEETTEY